MVTNWTVPLVLCLAAGAGIGYLLGSVNFAILVTRLFIKEDIRNHGSGNAGLTNVLRSVGKIPALITLIGDMSKGILAVLIIRFLLSSIAGVNGWFPGDYAAIYGALLGHLFPLYYHFKGGKGILVSFGAIMVLSPLAGLICLGAFLVCVISTRYVSLGSIVAGMVFPLSILLLNILYLGHLTYEVVLALPVGLIILFMHRENIKRLCTHTERKLSFTKKGQ